MQKIKLPQLTLCCVDTTGRIPTSLQAMERCLDQIEFGDAMLLTLPELLVGQVLPAGLRTVSIAPLTSIEAYSHFMVKDLGRYISTSHCLVVQWDGYVLNATQWDDQFFAYDYIGAPWQHKDGTVSVGNGGFSLRSKRLLMALEADSVVSSHPEDVCICTVNREYLEAQGIRFAPLELASSFSVEDGELRQEVFGFHGPHHLPKLLGPQAMVRFLQSFSPEKLLFSNLFDMLLRELTLSARRDPAFKAALATLANIIERALTEHKLAAQKSAYSLVICKALIRYGQYESADLLVKIRLEEGGWTWANTKLFLRLAMYRGMKRT